MYVDVHCHLDDPKLDLKKVIPRALEEGVKYMISNGTNVKSNREVLKISKKHKEVKAALGFYPLDAIKVSEEEFLEELDFIKKQKIVALGEVGLDGKWEPETISLQKKRFEEIISLSEKMKIPLIVHSRKAEQECIDILESCKSKVVFHCYGGNMTQAKRIIDNGWYFSIPTSIGNSKNLKKVVDNAFMSQLLSETDSPYLSPYQSQINEPANIPVVINEIASIKKMEKIEVMNNIFFNFKKVFDKI